MLRPSWHAHAACAPHDADLFFSIDHGDQHRAKTICRGCPVLRPCLEYALREREPEGVWGGLTADERRALRHRAV